MVIAFLFSLFFILVLFFSTNGPFSNFVTAGKQPISIHGTMMIAHVVQGPNLIGLNFFTSISFPKEEMKSVCVIITASILLSKCH